MAPPKNTKLERRILNLKKRSYKIAEIAKKLKISIGRVEYHFYPKLKESVKKKSAKWFRNRYKNDPKFRKKHNQRALKWWRNENQ